MEVILLLIYVSVFQVPLGVIPKNENKTKEMIAIMEELHRYVPSSESTSDYVRVPFAGDQLTATRAREVRDIRVNSKSCKSSLRGLVPFATDWHAKVNVVLVCKLFLSK